MWPRMTVHKSNSNLTFLARMHFKSISPPLHFNVGNKSFKILNFPPKIMFYVTDHQSQLRLRCEWRQLMEPTLSNHLPSTQLMVKLSKLDGSCAFQGTFFKYWPTPASFWIFVDGWAFYNKHLMIIGHLLCWLGMYMLPGSTQQQEGVWGRFAP